MMQRKRNFDVLSNAGIHETSSKDPQQVKTQPTTSVFLASHPGCQTGLDPGVAPPKLPVIPHNHHGVEAMFKTMVYARTEEFFFQAYSALKQEFSNQPAILRYIQKIWMPSREQWATCYTKNYKNYGARATSTTEASNFNIKSYLLNGKSTSFRLFKAAEALAKRQGKAFLETLAREAVNTKQNYLTRTYLGSLPRTVSYKALELINQEYRIAKAAFPTPGRTAIELKPCNECTAPLQDSIPCKHKIYNIIVTKRKLRLWDVNPHWHLGVRLVSIYDLVYRRSLTYARMRETHTFESAILRLLRSRGEDLKIGRFQCLLSMPLLQPSAPHSQRQLPALQASLLRIGTDEEGPLQGLLGVLRRVSSPISVDRCHCGSVREAQR